MKVGFIIPLKSKKISNDWLHTSELLKQTLHSIYKQTCKDFMIVIVGHEKPEIDNFENNQCVFVESYYPLKAKPGIKIIRSSLDIEWVADKMQKLYLGFIKLQLSQPDYYMVLDADDILHKDFIQHIVERKNPNGYLVKKGFQYFQSDNRVIKNYHIEKICGSTTILHKSIAFDVNKIDKNDFGVLLWNQLSHEQMESHFEKCGRPLQEIPFFSVLYTLNHGQNASDQFRLSVLKKLKGKLKIILLGRRLSKKIKTSFNLFERS